MNTIRFPTERARPPGVARRAGRVIDWAEVAACEANLLAALARVRFGPTDRLLAEYFPGALPL